MVPATWKTKAEGWLEPEFEAILGSTNCFSWVLGRARHSCWWAVVWGQSEEGRSSETAFLPAIFFICLKLTFKDTLSPPHPQWALAPSSLLSRTKENLKKYQSVLETSQDSGCLCCLLLGEKATPVTALRAWGGEQDFICLSSQCGVLGPLASGS